MESIFRPGFLPVPFELSSSSFCSLSFFENIPSPLLQAFSVFPFSLMSMNQQAQRAGLKLEGSADILRVLVKAAEDWPHLTPATGKLWGWGWESSSSISHRLSSDV